jgi:aspartyl-tRNA(Asn)/glutamyl-tRNA(Gln) amidotransferase subunit A
VTQTARQRVDVALESARVWQPSTNAFSRLLDDEARAAADAADAVEVVDAVGREAAPLAGMPVAVKDLFDVRGHPTTGCCAAIGSDPAERDAALVERLRGAGAIVIGKTTMHELAAGVTGLESACGPTRNPWDPARMTGGSSGGSAAAVAIDAVPVSLVSDTGGSARIPASFCGVWGLKATHGLLPLDGMMPLAPEMDCPGLIAESGTGLRVAWEALAGPIATIPTSLRVGVLRGGRWERCGVDVRRALDAAIGRLRSEGIGVRDVDGSELDDVHHVWNRIVWPSFAEGYPNLADDPALGRGTAALLRWGLDHRDERADALVRARRIRGWFAGTFEDVDALLTATTPYVAPMLDETEVDLGDGTSIDTRAGGPAWFTTAANVAGLPAMSVPFARTNERLPIGLQLIGPPGGEPALFAAEALIMWSGSERPALPEP